MLTSDFYFMTAASAGHYACLCCQESVLAVLRNSCPTRHESMSGFSLVSQGALWSVLLDQGLHSSII